MAKTETKVVEKVIEKAKVIFTDPDKYDRAVGILAVMNGKSATSHLRACYSLEGIEAIKVRMVELMAEEEVKLADPEALTFIYKKLGGGVITHERAEAIKKYASKNKIGARKDSGKDTEEKDEEEEKKDEDEDE